MDKAVKEIMQRTREALEFPNSMVVVFTKHGADDWEVYYPYTDFSMRGTRQDALKEISDLMEWNDNKGGN